MAAPVTGPGACNSYFEHVIALADGEIRVYRCEWGWYVKSPYREARSRYLDKALEEVLGKLDRTGLHALVDTLGRQLTIGRNTVPRSRLLVACNSELQAPATHDERARVNELVQRAEHGLLGRRRLLCFEAK